MIYLWSRLLTWDKNVIRVLERKEHNSVHKNFEMDRIHFIHGRPTYGYPSRGSHLITLELLCENLYYYDI